MLSYKVIHNTLRRVSWHDVTTFSTTFSTTGGLQYFLLQELSLSLLWCNGWSNAERCQPWISFFSSFLPGTFNQMKNCRTRLGPLRDQTLWYQALVVSGRRSWSPDLNEGGNSSRSWQGTSLNLGNRTSSHWTRLLRPWCHPDGSMCWEGHQLLHGWFRKNAAHRELFSTRASASSSFFDFRGLSCQNKG